MNKNNAAIIASVRLAITLSIPVTLWGQRTGTNFLANLSIILSSLNILVDTTTSKGLSGFSNSLTEDRAYNSGEFGYHDTGGLFIHRKPL